MDLPRYLTADLPGIHPGRSLQALILNNTEEEFAIATLGMQYMLCIASIIIKMCYIAE